MYLPYIYIYILCIYIYIYLCLMYIYILCIYICIYIMYIYILCIYIIWLLCTYIYIHVMCIYVCYVYYIFTHVYWWVLLKMRHPKPAVSLLKRQVLDFSRAPKLRRHRENMVQLTGKDLCVSVCGVGYSCCGEELVTETGQMVRQSHGSFYIGWKTAEVEEEYRVLNRLELWNQTLKNQHTDDQTLKRKREQAAENLSGLNWAF
jgi:hypothetical protein